MDTATGVVPLVAFVLGAILAYLYLKSSNKNEVLFFPDERMPCRTFYQELETSSQVTCRQHNCQFAHSGDELTSFMRILASLKEASEKIDLCVYNFTERQLSNILIRKFNEGVKVRIITDAHIDRQNTDTADAQKRSDTISTLQRAGIPVKINATNGGQSTFGALMHNKFVVIDDHYLLMGSFNWTHNAILKNHEAVIKTNNSKLVSEFRDKFQDMWLELGDRPLEIITR